MPTFAAYHHLLRGALLGRAGYACATASDPFSVPLTFAAIVMSPSLKFRVKEIQFLADRAEAGEKDVYEEVAKLIDASPLFDFQHIRRCVVKRV